MAFEINSNDDIDGDVTGEGQPMKLKVVGKPVNQRELDEHQITHMPYKSWCPLCVKNAATNK